MATVSTTRNTDRAIHAMDPNYIQHNSLRHESSCKHTLSSYVKRHIWKLHMQQIMATSGNAHVLIFNHSSFPCLRLLRFALCAHVSHYIWRDWFLSFVSRATDCLEINNSGGITANINMSWINYTEPVEFWICSCTVTPGAWHTWVLCFSLDCPWLKCPCGLTDYRSWNSWDTHSIKR